MERQGGGDSFSSKPTTPPVEGHTRLSDLDVHCRVDCVSGIAAPGEGTRQDDSSAGSTIPQKTNTHNTTNIFPNNPTYNNTNHSRIYYVPSPRHNNNNASTTRFVLVVGREATGHHLWATLMEKSPTVLHSQRWWRFWWWWWPKGCALQRHQPNPTLGLERHRRRGPQPPGYASGMPSTARYTVPHTRVAGAGQGSDTSTDHSSGPYHTGRPDNVLLNGNGPNGNMWSFPTDHDWGRRKSPSLDVSYETCQMAGVVCGHVYLFRDPREVVVSTTVHREIQSHSSRGSALVH